MKVKLRNPRVKMIADSQIDYCLKVTDYWYYWSGSGIPVLENRVTDYDVIKPS